METFALLLSLYLNYKLTYKRTHTNTHPFKDSSYNLIQKIKNESERNLMPEIVFNLENSYEMRNYKRKII